MPDPVEMESYRRLKQVTTQNAKSARSVAGDGSGPHDPSMDSRLSKLEGAFDWVKVTIAFAGTVMLAGFALLATQLVRLDGRVDRVETKVDAASAQASAKIDALSGQVGALPDRMNATLRDLTGVLSQAITAARQSAPQVILVPSPPFAPPPSTSLPQAPPLPFNAPRLPDAPTSPSAPTSPNAPASPEAPR